MTSRPGHRQPSLLEWLPERFEGIAPEFCDLVQEEDATVPRCYMMLPD